MKCKLIILATAVGLSGCGVAESPDRKESASSPTVRQQQGGDAKQIDESVLKVMELLALTEAIHRGETNRLADLANGVLDRHILAVATNRPTASKRYQSQADWALIRAARLREKHPVEYGERMAEDGRRINQFLAEAMARPEPSREEVRAFGMVVETELAELTVWTLFTRLANQGDTNALLPQFNLSMDVALITLDRLLERADETQRGRARAVLREVALSRERHPVTFGDERKKTGEAVTAILQKAQEK